MRNFKTRQRGAGAPSLARRVSVIGVKMETVATSLYVGCVVYEARRMELRPMDGIDGDGLREGDSFDRTRLGHDGKRSIGKPPARRSVPRGRLKSATP
jgi:hypothetical protein